MPKTYPAFVFVEGDAITSIDSLTGRQLQQAIKLLSNDPSLGTLRDLRRLAREFRAAGGTPSDNVIAALRRAGKWSMVANDN